MNDLFSINKTTYDACSSMAYYIINNMEQDFLVNPIEEHIFIDALTFEASQTLDEYYSIKRSVAIELLKLMSLGSTFNFSIVCQNVDSNNRNAEDIEDIDFIEIGIDDLDQEDEDEILPNTWTTFAISQKEIYSLTNI